MALSHIKYVPVSFHYIWDSHVLDKTHNCSTIQCFCVFTLVLIERAAKDLMDLVDALLDAQMLSIVVSQPNNC